MVRTALISLLAIALGGLSYAAGWLARPAALHLAFAAGVLPLIFGAMLHFVPVLTQTGDPGKRLHRLPEFARLAGLFAVAALAGWLPYVTLALAATVDFFLAAILLRWIIGRARATLGRPHPCWRWYALALGLAMLAFVAAFILASAPESWRHWKHVHLHLNTLGLVGLAAFGTLPVLLPTTLGQVDTQAAVWLRRRLAVFAGAALMVAAGGWWPPLAVAGALAQAVVVCELLGRWLRAFGWRALVGDGAAVSLSVAAAGYVLQLLAGIAHGLGGLPAAPGVAAWAVGFLLPLVSGALTHLLPVWRWPGPVSEQRRQARAELARFGWARAVCWALGGAVLAGGLDGLGLGLAAAGLLPFLVAVVRTLRI